ncbi:MAG: hypothetical protein D6723_14060 [Acidobacteria bacterium]|nr:MAG: hypothetical protein D6723_14060 [Acidobacteriota bacterium]
MNTPRNRVVVMAILASALGFLMTPTSGHPLMGRIVAQDQPIPLIINEVLARVPIDDPETEQIEGDANGDGLRQANLDEFVELINVGTEPLDVSGFQVDDAGSAGSFFFPAGTVIPPGEAAVIFGGGDLDLSPLEFGNVRALGLLFVAGGARGLALNNSGDSVIVRDPMGREVVRFDYDAQNPVPQPVFQSFNRNPDLVGPFDNHSQIMGADQTLFSPGTRVDGRAFRRFIGDLVPDQGPLSGGNQVMIEGAGFGREIDSVTIGGRPATSIERVDSLQLIVTVPPGDMAGAVDVIITDQFGEIVARQAYTYQSSAQAGTP